MSAPSVAIIGGGIAGASVAAHLAAHGPVTLLEREDMPGYHASGRSAALFSETYGNAVVRALSVASRPELERPAEGFAPVPILHPRGVLHVGEAGQEARLDRLHAEGSRLQPSVRRIAAADALALVPRLRAEIVVGGVLEPEARDIDTDALVQAYLRRFRAAGGRVVTRAEVSGLSRTASGWRIATRTGPIEADLVVNAAGAWADEVAALAGLAPLGLQPKRRTAFLFEPPPGFDVRGWPMVIGAAEDVYMKPDAGLLLGSPADETDSPPCDAAPDEMDVAVAVDRIERLADLPIRRIVRRWAGLRTFAPDRTPVVGFDPRAEGFLWLAGQGGYGFQTAPALARTAAALAHRGAIPADVAALGVTAEALAPERLLFAP